MKKTKISLFETFAFAMISVAVAATNSFAEPMVHNSENKRPCRYLFLDIIHPSTLGNHRSAYVFDETPDDAELSCLTDIWWDATRVCYGMFGMSPPADLHSIRFNLADRYNEINPIASCIRGRVQDSLWRREGSISRPRAEPGRLDFIPDTTGGYLYYWLDPVSCAVTEYGAYWDEEPNTWGFDWEEDAPSYWTRQDQVRDPNRCAHFAMRTPVSAYIEPPQSSSSSSSSSAPDSCALAFVENRPRRDGVQCCPTGAIFGGESPVDMLTRLGRSGFLSYAHDSWWQDCRNLLQGDPDGRTFCRQNPTSAALPYTGYQCCTTVLCP